MKRNIKNDFLGVFESKYEDDYWRSIKDEQLIINHFNYVKQKLDKYNKETSSIENIPTIEYIHHFKKQLRICVLCILKIEQFKKDYSDKILDYLYEEYSKMYEGYDLICMKRSCSDV
mgnify:CR=1 FL=1